MTADGQLTCRGLHHFIVPGPKKVAKLIGPRGNTVFDQSEGFRNASVENYAFLGLGKHPLQPMNWEEESDDICRAKLHWHPAYTGHFE